MKPYYIILCFVFFTTGSMFAQGAGNALEFLSPDYVDCGNNSSLKPSDQVMF